MAKAPTTAPTPAPSGPAASAPPAEAPAPAAQPNGFAAPETAAPESYGRAVVGLRGSALHGRKSEISQVTGERNNTGPKFDARGPGTSDWDLFVVNKGLHAAIVRKGMDPQSLTPKQLYDLGYTGLADGLRSLTGRRANTTLRVYPNFDALSGKHRGVDGQGNRSFLLLE